MAEWKNVSAIPNPNPITRNLPMLNHRRHALGLAIEWSCSYLRMELFISCAFPSMLSNSRSRSCCSRSESLPLLTAPGEVERTASRLPRATAAAAVDVALRPRRSFCNISGGCDEPLDPGGLERRSAVAKRLSLNEREDACELLCVRTFGDCDMLLCTFEAHALTGIPTFEAHALATTCGVRGLQLRIRSSDDAAAEPDRWSTRCRRDGVWYELSSLSSNSSV